MYIEYFSTFKGKVIWGNRCDCKNPQPIETEFHIRDTWFSPKNNIYRITYEAGKRIFKCESRQKSFDNAILDNDKKGVIPYEGEVFRNIWYSSNFHKTSMFGEIRINNEEEIFKVYKVSLSSHFCHFIKKEFEILASIQDISNVVRIYHHPILDLNSNIVGYKMEMLQKSLFEISKEKRMIVIKEVEKVVDILHKRGMYHNDISIDNVMIDSLGITKLIDFGSSTKVGDKIPEDHPLRFSERYKEIGDTYKYNKYCIERLREEVAKIE